MELEFNKNCIIKDVIRGKRKVTTFKNYMNLNRPEWEGVLDITADWFERGICVTLVIIKDLAPVDGFMMTFTRRTLVDNLVKAFGAEIKHIRKKHGQDVANHVENALVYINEMMHSSFVPLDEDIPEGLKN